MRNDNGLFRVARFHHHCHRLPIHQIFLRIGDHCLHQHGIGRAIGGDINEVKAACAVQHGPIGQSHADLDAIRRAGTAFAAELQQLPLCHGEADADRVIAHNRHQRARIRAHDIAGAERRTPRAAIKRRADFGIAVIDLGLLQLRFRRRHLGLGFCLCRDAVIQGRLRDGVGFHQFPPARHLRGGIGQISPRAIKLRAAECHFGGEGRLFQGEQQLPGLHRIALIEMPRLQKPGDAGHDIHPVNRLHPANEIRAAADGLAFHAADKNCRRRGGGLLAGGWGFLLATGQERQGQSQYHRKRKARGALLVTQGHGGHSPSTIGRHAATSQ